LEAIIPGFDRDDGFRFPLFRRSQGLATHIEIVRMTTTAPPEIKVKKARAAASSAKYPLRFSVMPDKQTVQAGRCQLTG